MAWLHLWEQQGLEGLKLKPGRGRKPKLDKDKHAKVIKTLIENEPKKLTRVVAQIESELDIKVSKKTLQHFLKNLNISGSDLKNV